MFNSFLIIAINIRAAALRIELGIIWFFKPICMLTPIIGWVPWVQGKVCTTLTSEIEPDCRESDNFHFVHVPERRHELKSYCQVKNWQFMGKNSNLYCINVKDHTLIKTRNWSTFFFHPMNPRKAALFNFFNTVNFCWKGMTWLFTQMYAYAEVVQWLIYSEILLCSISCKQTYRQYLNQCTVYFAGQKLSLDENFRSVKRNNFHFVIWRLHVLPKQRAPAEHCRCRLSKGRACSTTFMWKIWRMRWKSELYCVEGRQSM